MNRLLSCLLVASFLALYGCGPVISGNLRTKVDLSLSLSEVARDPEAHKGAEVIWGGKIVRLLPQEDETIYVEVRQLHLDSREKPSGSHSQGNFLMVLKGGFDLSPFQEGTKITVAGEIQGAIQGKKIKNISELDLEYVVVKSEEFHLWKDYFPPQSSPPPPASLWWYDPTTPGLRL